MTPLEPAAFAALRAPVWKAFTFETGHFLLHVPTSHVLQVAAELARHVSGEAPSAAAAEHLDALAADLPAPPPRQVQTDIRAISLNMAQGCNLRCTYCFAGEGDYGVKGMMSRATAVAAIERLSAGKDRFTVIFFGGEPMLNFAVIKEVVAWCEEQTACRYSFAMTTNATLLNEEKMAWLREKSFALTISYDGKGLHARQRLNKDLTSNSESLVERKLKAFDESLTALRSMTLRTTISRENIDALEESLLATLTSKTFRLRVSAHATPFKKLAFSMADVEALGAVYRRVVDRLIEQGDYAGLLRLENVRKGVDQIRHGRTRQMSCGAGVSYLTVSVEGAFYLCHRFNEDESERFGSVDTGLDEAKLAEIAAFRGATKDPCNTCWMREWCAGGCFHEHKAAHGDKLAVDPVFCRLQALEYEQAFRVYTILLEKAPHLVQD